MTDTSGDRQIKAALDEAIAPRLADQERFIAYPASEHFAVESADLLYVFDHHHTQYLDFTCDRLPMGHRHAAMRAGMFEQMNHYEYLGAPGEHVARMPVEYARLLAESLESEDGPPMAVHYCDDEREARLLAAHMGIRLSPNGEPVFLELVNRKGVLMQPARTLEEVRVAQERGVAVIADETATGFGRTGMLWGQHKWQVYADITIVGGPAGGSFPFGAVVAPKDWFRSVRLATTPWAGHPVICAAGMAVFKQIHEGLLEHVLDASYALHDALGELVAQFPAVVTATRGSGLLQYLVCADADTAQRLVAGSFARGLLLPAPYEETIRLTPPLVISENEARRAVDMLSAVCLDWEADR